MRKLFWVLKGNYQQFCLFLCFCFVLFKITHQLIFTNKVATLRFSDEKVKIKTAMSVK